jgi:hypothetical protein
MFDGYHQWLGIPKDQRPPTLYQLLGIAPDEQDPEVIRRAVLERSARVRIHQAGQHAEECRQVLDKLAFAGLTLRNPPKRKEYDATLAQPTTPTGLPAQDDGPTRNDRPAVPPMKVPDLQIELPEVPLSNPRQPASLLFRIANIIFVIGCLSVLGHNWFTHAPSRHNPPVALSTLPDREKKPALGLKPSRKDPGLSQENGSEPGPSATVGPTPETPVEDTPRQIFGERGLEPKETLEIQDPLIPPAPDAPPGHLPPHPPSEPSRPKATKDPIADTPADLLERNRLKREKVATKRREASAQLQSFLNARDRQLSFQDARTRLDLLNEESKQAGAMIGYLNGVLPKMPRGNNIQNGQFMVVQAQRDQLQNDEHVRQMLINQLRDVLPPWQERDKELKRIESEVEHWRNACQETIRELRQLGDATEARPGVMEWMNKAEKALKR